MHTNIHIYEPKYILKYVPGSNSLGPSIIQKFLFWYFFALHTNGKRCSQEGFCPCYSHSQIVYACHIFKSVATSICLVKYHFWTSFGPDRKTEMGVVIYMHLKHSPDYIDSKYIWVHWSNSLGQVFLIKYHFYHIQPCSGKGRGLARWDPAHVTPRVKLYMHTKF